jgi:tetratricopeptide (TPR) repeat protein
LIDVDQKLIAGFRAKPLPARLKPSEAQRALEAGLTTALDLKDAVNAQTFLKALESEPETPGLELAKGRLALLQNALRQAKAFLEKAVSSHPDSPEPAYWFAVAERRSGDATAALSRINGILQLHPQFIPALEQQMELAADRGDFQLALSAQLKQMALILNPPAYEYGRLGALWLEVSNFSEAESVLLRGLGKNPYCYACHFELGELYIRTGKFPMARQNFEWVVRFFPDSDSAAFKSLVGVDLLLKDIQSAKGVLAEGLRLFPDDAGLLKAQAGMGG